MGWVLPGSPGSAPEKAPAGSDSYRGERRECQGKGPQGSHFPEAGDLSPAFQSRSNVGWAGSVGASQAITHQRHAPLEGGPKRKCTPGLVGKSDRQSHPGRASVRFCRRAGSAPGFHMQRQRPRDGKAELREAISYRKSNSRTWKMY